MFGDIQWSVMIFIQDGQSYLSYTWTHTVGLTAWDGAVSKLALYAQTCHWANRGLRRLDNDYVHFCNFSCAKIFTTLFSLTFTVLISMNHWKSSTSQVHLIVTCVLLQFAAQFKLKHMKLCITHGMRHQHSHFTSWGVKRASKWNGLWDIWHPAGSHIVWFVM